MCWSYKHCGIVCSSWVIQLGLFYPKIASEMVSAGRTCPRSPLLVCLVLSTVSVYVYPLFNLSTSNLVGVQPLLQVCRMEQQEGGHYPGHMFVVMVIHYLQQRNPQVLPVLHEVCTWYMHGLVSLWLQCVHAPKCNECMCECIFIIFHSIGQLIPILVASVYTLSEMSWILCCVISKHILIGAQHTVKPDTLLALLPAIPTASSWSLTYVLLAVRKRFCIL